MHSGEVNDESGRRLAERGTDRLGHSWSAEQVDRITNGQHHDSVAATFPHLEAISMRGDGGVGWLGEVIDQGGTSFDHS
jgi:hypothetical protein